MAQAGIADKHGLEAILEHAAGNDRRIDRQLVDPCQQFVVSLGGGAIGTYERQAHRTAEPGESAETHRGSPQKLAVRVGWRCQSELGTQ